MDLPKSCRFQNQVPIQKFLAGIGLVESPKSPCLALIPYQSRSWPSQEDRAVCPVKVLLLSQTHHQLIGPGQNRLMMLLVLTARHLASQRDREVQTRYLVMAERKMNRI